MGRDDKGGESENMNPVGIVMLVTGFLLIAVPGLGFGSAVYKAEFVKMERTNLGWYCFYEFQNGDGIQEHKEKCDPNSSPASFVSVRADKSESDDWMTVFMVPGVILVTLGAVVGLVTMKEEVKH